MIVTSSLVHKRQSHSLKKSKCIDRGSLDVYNFTGERFETTYNVFSCRELCYARSFYEECQCPPYSGWNITKTECLEKQNFRDCIVDPQTFFNCQPKFEKCNRRNCWRRCNENILLTSAQTIPLALQEGAVITMLKEITTKVPDPNSLAVTLLEQINDSYFREKGISGNLAQLSVYLDGGPVANLQIVEMVPFATFISNLGGLLGMWLGLSVISIMQLVESLLQKTLANRLCYLRTVEEPN